MEFQTLDQWEHSARGLMPVEATMMVALPELDGAIWPMTFGGRSAEAPGDGRRVHLPHPDLGAIDPGIEGRAGRWRRGDLCRE